MALSGGVSIANSVAVWVFMARWRPPEEIGRFTVVMSFYMLFFTICSLGLGPFIVNEISKRINDGDENSAAGFVATANVSLLAWGAVCAVLMTAAAFVFSPSADVRLAAFILSFAMIPTGAITCAEAFAISRGRARLIAGVNVLENLLRTAIPIALIYAGFALPWICAAFVFVRVVSLFVYFMVDRSIAKFNAFDRTVFKLLVRSAPTFAGITVLASLNWQISTLLLGRFGGEIEAARYGVASRFLIPVMILMSGYAGVIQPMLAGKTGAALGEYLAKVTRNLLLAATAGALLAPFFTEFVLTMLFGEKFAASAPSLNVLALTVVPFCAVMILGRGLVATGAQHVDLIANGVAVGVCFVSGLFLIPRYGALGAAVAQLCSFVAMALVEIAFLSKSVLDFRVWRATLFSFACLAIVCVLIWK